MKIVMTARWTGWIKEEPFERQYRYPMFAAAHAVSLIKNGGVYPQDIIVISNIENNSYLDFLDKIGVQVLVDKSNLNKFTKCIQVAKQNPEDIVCWVDADMYLFNKIDFSLTIKNLLSKTEMLTGDGGLFDPINKITKVTEQWNPEDFINVWGFSIQELIDWSIREKRKWCLGVLYALKSETLIKYEKQLDRNSYDELLAFALSKLVNTDYVLGDQPKSENKLIIKHCDSSRFFYLQNPCDSKSMPQDFYWVHYGGGFKVLNINTHIDDFCNSIINHF